jgi:hypothetical protein
MPRFASIQLTWSVGTEEGTCPKCDARTVLVVAPDMWRMVDEDAGADPGVSIYDEVSGHACPKCNRLISLSFNS